jgi:hypothetical protein
MNLTRTNKGEENTIVFQDPSRVKTPRINPQTLTLKKHPLSVLSLQSFPSEIDFGLHAGLNADFSFSNASYGISRWTVVPVSPG